MTANFFHQVEASPGLRHKTIKVGAEVAKNLTLNLDAQVQHGNNWNAARVNAGLRYKF